MSKGLSSALFGSASSRHPLGAPDVQFVGDQEDREDEAQDRDQRLAKLALTGHDWQLAAFF